MKKIVFILIAILSIGLTSCQSCSNGKKENSHTHEDGSVHEAHGTDDATKPAATQESFKVEADSTTTKELAKPVKKAHDHSSESGHKH